MKKNLNKLATLALTGMMVAGMSFGAMAKEIGENGAVSVNGDDNTLTLKKQMKIVDVDDNNYSDEVSAPGITYTYTVTAAGEDEMGSKTTEGITRLPGLGKIADKTVTFTTTQRATSGILSCDLTLDFSNLLEAENVKPGIYRYKLTESGYSSTDKDFEYTREELVENTSKTRFVDVYVGYAEESGGSVNYDGGLKILGYVVCYTDGEEGKTRGYEVKEAEGGVEGFGTVYKTFDVKVTKTVTGAFGNKEGQYEFGAAVPMPSGASYGYKFNEETVASKTGDLAVGDVKLNDKQYFTIKGVPAGHTVTVKEKDYTNEGYTTTVNSNAYNAASGAEAVFSSSDGATVLAFTNTKTEVPVTGVVVDIAPYAAMILGAGAFAGIFLGKKKSENED